MISLPQMCFQLLTKSFCAPEAQAQQQAVSPGASCKADCCLRFLLFTTPCLGSAPASQFRYKEKKKRYPVLSIENLSLNEIHDFLLPVLLETATSFLKDTCIPLDFTAKQISLH